MIQVLVTKQDVRVMSTELLVSGSVNANRVSFQLSEEWATLSPTIVFRAGEEEVSVIPEDGGCLIPWEVLADYNTGETLYVGIYGVGEGQVVIPTMWARVGIILEGTEPAENTLPPTPSAYEQYVTAIHEDATIAQSAAQTTAVNAATASQEAARASEAAGVSQDAAAVSKAAEAKARAAEGISVNASQNAELSADQAIAAKNAAESAKRDAESAADTAVSAAEDANRDAVLAETAAGSADLSAGMALKSEQNAKAAETVSQQSAREAVAAWNNIRQQTVITAERTYPTAPQIDFTVTEATQALAFTDIGGVPIQQFNFTEMRFYCENAVQTAADASELRVALNRSSTGMYTAATDFLIATRTLFTGGGVSLQDGIAWTTTPQTNRAWRGDMNAQVYPFLEYGRTVRSVNFWSNLSLIPVGTKIQVWLR